MKAIYHPSCKQSNPPPPKKEENGAWRRGFGVATFYGLPKPTDWCQLSKSDRGENEGVSGVLIK